MTIHNVKSLTTAFERTARQLAQKIYIPDSLGRYAITLYDEFFNSNKKSRILSHEISHLYLFERSREEIATLVYLMGWREETKTKNLIRITNSPRLKPKSLLDLSEDIADHFEYYLHYPQVY